MEREAFLKKLETIRDLPTLPQVALEINRLLENPEVTMEKVADTIEKDQAIVPKLLRLVNSSFFGLEKKVGDVARAVVILGFNMVRNAIVSVSIIDSLKGIQNARLDFSDFWRHAVSCAVTSDYLAVQCGVRAHEDAFTAGLIHDIGKLVLAKYFPNEFVNIIQDVNSGVSFYNAESNVLPIHHNQIGAYLAKRWHLPPVIIQAIHHSHGAHNFSDQPIAFIISNVENILEGSDELFFNQKDFVAPPVLAEKMRTLIDSQEEWMPGVLEEIENACSVLMGGFDNGK